MKKLLAVLSIGALAALVAPTAAGAQSLRDLPAGGNEFCDGFAEFISQAESNGAPAEFVGGMQEIFNGACGGDGGGEEPAPDEGDDGDAPGPHCEVFTGVITGMEDNGAPAELIDGVKQISDGAGCATGGDETPDTTTTTAPAGDDDDTTTTTQAEVAGETETSDTGGGGGTALPATGGGLIAGGAGLGLVGLAAVARRLFGAA